MTSIRVGVYLLRQLPCRWSARQQWPGRLLEKQQNSQTSSSSGLTIWAMRTQLEDHRTGAVGGSVPMKLVRKGFHTAA